MYDAADDADRAHHAGGEQETMRAVGVDEVALVIHRTEYLQKRQAGDRADACAKSTAEVAKDVD